MIRILIMIIINDQIATLAGIGSARFTFSRWCGLETRACGMILAA